MEDIHSRSEFVRFLENFRAEFQTNDFENTTLENFLEAMQSWIEDMDGYYQNMGKPECLGEETLTWQMLVDILEAARIYE